MSIMPMYEFFSDFDQGCNVSHLPECKLFSDFDSICNSTKSNESEEYDSFSGSLPLNLFDDDTVFDLPELLFTDKSAELNPIWSISDLPEIEDTFIFKNLALLPSDPRSPSKTNFDSTLEHEIEPLNCNFNFNESIDNILNSDFTVDTYNKVNSFECIQKEAYQEQVEPQYLQTDTDIPKSSNLLPSGNKLSSFPIKLVVKKFGKNSKMVAPFNTPSATFSYVQIPSGIGCRRVSIIKGGGKLSSNALIKPKEEIEKPKQPLEMEKSSQTECSMETGKPTISIAKVPKSLKRNSSDLSVNDYESSTKKSLKLSELPFTSLKKKKQTTSRRIKKVKAYELDPLGDPMMEKCRRNAINAKKNRDIKKIRMMELEEKVNIEREEKLRLAGENEDLKNTKEQLEERLQHLTSLLQDPSKLSSLLQKVTQGINPTETILNAPL